MAVITLELRPGLGVGAFTLGMPVCEALAQIQQHKHLFATTEIKYSEESPLLRDLILNFPDHGFHLRFEPSSQRLRLVEVYDATKLQLCYANSVIGGPSMAATFVRVYALFGPTFPGVYDQGKGVYALFYPGLSFLFPIPSQYSEFCLKGEADPPLELPDRTTPVTSRILIFSSGPGGSVTTAMASALPPPLPPNSLYMEEVWVKRGEGLSYAVGGQTLAFETSAQDVWAELGCPACIEPKQVDTMVIHSAPESRSSTALCGDYFYSYFNRGMDILFDGQTHRIKKFVLHTNHPGHTDFNTYIKCNFVIDCEQEHVCAAETQSDHTSSASGQRQDDGSSQLSDMGRAGEGPDAGERREAARRGSCITADTRWETVQAILGDGGQAAIQTRGSTNCPFGATYVYGYRDVAFEVMKNGHIASVTLFRTSSSQLDRARGHP